MTEPPVPEAPVPVLADPVPQVLAALSGHAELTGALGGPDRVGAFNEPPYPRLRVVDTGGDDRSLIWLAATDVQVEALGDLDGSPGKAKLRHILYLALGVLAGLPERTGAPGAPVVTSVRSLRAGAWAPEPSGQPRYVAAVRVHAHP